MASGYNTIIVIIGLVLYSPWQRSVLRTTPFSVVRVQREFCAHFVRKQSKNCYTVKKNKEIWKINTTKWSLKFVPARQEKVKDFYSKAAPIAKYFFVYSIDNISACSFLFCFLLFIYFLIFLKFSKNLFEININFLNSW